MTCLLIYAAVCIVGTLFTCSLGRAAKRADAVDERIQELLRGK